MIGKMNWANLLDYVVQPADMELFQTYQREYAKAFLDGGRTKGVIFGGRVTPVSGLQVRVSAGLALMPDGQLVSFPQTDVTIASAHPSLPRIDRIELSYSLADNTAVVDVNSQAKVLDKLYTPSFDVLAGTANASPTAPVATSSKLSIALIAVSAGTLTILTSDISQVDGVGFIPSSIQLGDKNCFLRYNQTALALEFSTDGVTWRAVGSGGGGGGGANWQPVAGLAPVEDFEYSERVFKFSKDEGQALELWVKVPSSYVAGSPIVGRVSMYSPSASDAWKFTTVSTLVRKGVDAITTTSNQRTSTNGDVTNTLANLYQEVSFDLSSSVGQINGVSPQAGDLIKVQIARVTPSGAEDSADIRMIPSSTEVTFA